MSEHCRWQLTGQCELLQRWSLILLLSEALKAAALAKLQEAVIERTPETVDQESTHLQRSSARPIQSQEDLNAALDAAP